MIHHRLWMWVLLHLPQAAQRRIFAQKCPTCGMERDWHEWAVLDRNVFVDGMGVVQCKMINSLKEGRHA